MLQANVTLDPAFIVPVNGGQTPREVPSNEVVPLAPPLQPTLTQRTLETLRTSFTQHDHHPSDDMWTALTAIAETLEAMANGTCSSAIHLSSLDPGVGKTTTIIHFLKVLLASHQHREVAVLVCVRRREQIEAVVREADLRPEDFAVLTTDKELNALGCGSPHRARVVFTTHSMVERRCESRPFAEVAAFHYRGHPRAVRIWDEAILPGQTLTVSRDALGYLFKPLRGCHPALADALEDLFTKLRTMEDGALFTLPDLAELHGVDLNSALGIVSGGPSEQVAAVEALWFLFGKSVTIRRDGAYGNTLLDYRDTLPEDIKPLLALDASARVRTVYRFWEDRRGGINLLPGAVKRYDAHTIHVWNRGGGKSGFKKDGQGLVEGVVSTILQKPEQEWLVIHHKAGIDMDFEAEVRSLLPDTAANVHFLHWGVHDATNLYAHVPNVILAGTLFYRTSYYEALGRLASGLPSARGAFAEDDTHEIELGEHHHLILQALCRGAVRRCVDGGCPPTDTYIIASRNSGIPQSLATIFPGAQVARWQPVPKALKGKVAEAVAFITAQLAANPSSHVTFREVMAHLGWKDTRDFKRRIRQHEDFVEALDEAGVEEWVKGTRSTGFRVMARDAGQL